MQTIGLLNSDMIKELMPIIGHRALFIKNLENWKLVTKESEEIETMDIDFSEDGVDNPSTSDNIVTSSPLSFENHTNENEGKTKALLNLLQSSVEGKTILKLHQNDGLLSGRSRKKLCNIIIMHLLGEDPIRCRNVSSDILLQYASQIKEIFVKEKMSTYFIPYIYNKQLKIRRCAKGKLYDCLHNRKREYREAEKTIMHTKETPGATSNEKTAILIENVSDDITWLKTSTKPLQMVEEKWKKTSVYRLQELKDMTVSEYMSQYPGLKNPTGFHLLCLDFNNMYPDSSEKLYKSFDLYKKKIIDLAKIKYSRTAEETLMSILNEGTRKPQEERSAEEAENIAAFLILPHMVGHSFVKSKKSWRPSKQESRDGFITHVTRAMDLQECISKKKEMYSKLGVTFQPTIFIVGENLHSINQYFVLVDKIFYKIDGIVQAVDVCFKIHQALNCKYPVECERVWYFIQKAFYKITTPYDKHFISVNTFISDLGLLE